MRKFVLRRVVLILLAILFVFPATLVHASEDAPSHRNINACQIKNFSMEYALTGDGPTDMISIAFAQLGKRGYELGYGISWCTGFLRDCAILAGQSAVSALPDGFNFIEEYITENGGYEVSVEEAKPGDLCIFKNISYFAWHIALVYQADGENVYTIDGNYPATAYDTTNIVGTQEPASDIYKILRPNYTTYEIPAVRVVSNATTYFYTEEVELRWADVQDAEDYWLDIYCDGELVHAQSMGSENSYRFTPTQVGAYSAYVTTFRGENSVQSEPCEFVVNYGIPTVNVQTANQDVKIRWSNVKADSYYLYVLNADTNEILYEADMGKTFACNLVYDAGNYTARVVAEYCNGEKTVGSTDYSIYHYVATTDRGSNASYLVGETVTLSVGPEGVRRIQYKVYHIDESGEKTVVQSVQKAGNEASMVLEKAGTYECYFTVYTNYGYADSEPVTFYAAEVCLHTPELRNAVAATCTALGYSGDEVCSTCGELLKQGETLPMAEHTLVAVPGTEATCTNSGLTDGEKCAVCGEVTIEQTVIPRLNHAYQYTDNGDGTHTGTCSRCSKVLSAAEHTYIDGVCTDCGRGATNEPIYDASILFSHSLTLENDISINFIGQGSALSAYDSFYLECKVPIYNGNELTGYETVNIEPVFNGTNYEFTLTGITAKMMNDEIEAIFRLTKDGQEYYSKTDVYSVAEYAYGKLDSTKASDTDELKAICANLLRYGAMAQTQFNYRTDALVDSDMTEAHKAYLTDLSTVEMKDYRKQLADHDAPTVPWKSTTLELGNKVIMCLIVNLENYTGDPSELTMRLTFTDNNGAVITEERPLELYNPDAKTYAVRYDGLRATEMRSVVSAAIYNGETRVSRTVEYSIESYGARSSDTEMQQLCLAMLAYGDAANVFFSK